MTAMGAGEADEMPKQGRYRYTKKELEAAVVTSKTIADVLRKIGVVPRGGNYEVVRRRIEEWGIDAAHLSRARVRRTQIRENDAEIRRVVAKADSLAEVIRRLGGEITSNNYRKIRRAIARMASTHHMSGPGWRKGSTIPVVPPAPLSELLVRGRQTQTSRPCVSCVRTVTR